MKIIKSFLLSMVSVIAACVLSLGLMALLLKSGAHHSGAYWWQTHAVWLLACRLVIYITLILGWAKLISKLPQGVASVLSSIRAWHLIAFFALFEVVVMGNGLAKLIALFWR